jgi:hypothetical protein
MGYNFFHIWGFLLLQGYLSVRVLRFSSLVMGISSELLYFTVDLACCVIGESSVEFLFGRKYSNMGHKRWVRRDDTEYSCMN